MRARASVATAALAGLLVAGVPLAGGGRTSNQEPPARIDQQPIRAEATFVRVDVYPTRDGRPVQGLTADDFELFEDGIRQRIQTFEHVVVPIGPGTEIADPGSQRDMLAAARNPRARVVVVFLDIPHVTLFGSHVIKEPIIKLINRILGPDDLVGLMTPEMSASHVVLGRKTNVIEELLRKNWDWGQAADMVPRLTEREHMYEMCYPAVPYKDLAARMISKSRERKTLEAMQDLVTYLGAIREERKAVVAVSQGWRLQGVSQEMMNLHSETEPMPGHQPITVGPTGQPVREDPRKSVGVSKTICETDRLQLSQLDNQRFFRDLLDDANRANTSFYPIDPRGLVAPTGGAPLNTGSIEHLRELGDNTDGLAIVNTNDLDKVVRRIVEDLTSYYLLGYNSTNSRLDGRYRRIQVRTKHPGVQVRARRGYRAAMPEELSGSRAAPAPAGEDRSPVAGVMGSLSRLRSDTPFRLHAAYLLEGDRLKVWIAGELPAGAGAADEFAAGATAELEIQAGDRSTTAHVEIGPGQRGFLTAVTLPAAAELNVRARVSGAGSTAPVTDMLHASVNAHAARPLIFRRGPSTANRVVPAADVRFARADRLRLELPAVEGAKPGTARLLDRTGKPLQVPLAVGERTEAASGQRWITADLALAPLAAGDYAIEQAPDGMEKVITAIRVTR
jgi:VWFA-related protein